MGEFNSSIVKSLTIVSRFSITLNINRQQSKEKKQPYVLFVSLTLKLSSSSSRLFDQVLLPVTKSPSVWYQMNQLLNLE